MTSLGLSAEGTATRLFTAANPKEVDELEASLGDSFSMIEKSGKAAEQALKEMDAKEEGKTVASALAGLESVKSLLLSKDGIVQKVKNRLLMKEKSAKSMEDLRSLVLKQADDSKKTMSTAHKVQEQSIAQVNRVIRYSTLLIVVIGIAAVAVGILFGTWIFRSISKPLSRLNQATGEIAAGNLTFEMRAAEGDEIGMVEASTARMASSLKEIVGKIRAATGSLSSTLRRAFHDRGFGKRPFRKAELAGRTGGRGHSGDVADHGRCGEKHLRDVRGGKIDGEDGQGRAGSGSFEQQ